MKIEKALKEDIDEIVKIHLSAFPNNFTTKLGVVFLKKYYSLFIDNNKTRILCARNTNNQVTGFICGSENTKSFYTELIRNAPSLIIPLTKAALRENKIFSKILTKSYSILTKKQANPNVEEYCLAEIYSLAVNKEISELGTGSMLLKEYIKQEKNLAHKMGVFITTDNNKSNKKVVEFYKRNHFKHSKDFRQYPDREMSVYAYLFTENREDA